jgi:hypothetical protein
VSPQEIAALLRRHVVAVLVVAAIAAGVAYSIKRAPLTYQESATVYFTGPTSAANPNPYVTFSDALVEAAGTVAIIAMSPQGQQQVRAAGGTTAYDVALVNSYNLEFPLYGTPAVTVTSTSQDPTAVHQTFTSVTKVLERDLAERQAQVGVAPAHRIGIHIVNDTGPVALVGSSKRVFAGLLVLTIIAALFVASFLDRHRLRLGLRRLPPVRAVIRAVGRGEA